MRRTLATVAIAFGAGLGACASADQTPPGISEAATRAAPGYPNLADVPRQHVVNTDPAYWRGVAEDVEAARANLLDNPRVEYQPPEETPAEFLEQARSALEESRDSH